MPSETESKPEVNTPFQLALKPEAPAPQEEQKAFWKSLRHFYRTGEKPRGANNAPLASVFKGLINIPDAYPFRAGEEQIVFGKSVVYQLLAYQLAHFQRGTRIQFKDKLQGLINGLGKLLDIPDEADVDDKVYGFASEIIAFDKLKALVPKQNASSLDEQRKARLHEILGTLKQGLRNYDDQESLLLVAETNGFDQTPFKKAKIVRLTSDDVFSEAQNVLKSQMDAFTTLARALRIASLEVEGDFDEEVHNEYFNHFNWYRLLNDERGLLNPVCLIVNQKVLSQHQDSFSRLLSTNWPVRVLILNDLSVSEPNKHISWEDASHAYRQEISLLVMSHRNAYCFQSSLADPQTVFDALGKGLRSNHPAVLHILISQDSGDEDLVIAEAARLGRYFPGITYDPEKPKEQGSRLTIKDNPQPETAWPVFHVDFHSEGKKQGHALSFTYADYKALFTQKLDELMLVPPAYADDNLLPVHEYLALPQNQLYGKIPFVWLTDQEGLLHRAAVPNNWVVSCQERTDFWNFLKEMSGTVSASLPKGQPQEDLETLRQVHQSELAKAKEAAAGLAVNRILQELLGD